MRRRLLFSLLGVAVSLTLVASARAALLIGQMQCKASYQGSPISGIVQAYLWHGTSKNFRGLMPYLMRGELHRLPGTVQLFGHLQYQGSLVNFDVHLTQGDQGTGAYWSNGMSHRSTYMKLVLKRGGFVIHGEDGAVVPYSCQLAETSGRGQEQPYQPTW